MSTIDQAKVEDFANNLFGHAVGAVTIACVEMARRLGFYEHLASNSSMTADELSESAETNPRLTRELLDQQASAGILTYDQSTDGYSLSPEGAAVIADKHSPAWMMGAVMATCAMYLGHDKVEKAFRGDGGMPWGDHAPCLFCGTAEFFRPVYEHFLIPQFIPALSRGVERLKENAVIADVGCGTGVSTMKLAEAYPKSHFVGMDFHQPSIAEASQKASEMNLSNAEFVTASAKDYSGDYDLICFFDCLHDMGDPVGIASYAKERLKPGGSIMLIEPFAYDSRIQNHEAAGSAFYGFSSFFCVPCSLSQEVGRGMGSQSGEIGMRAVFEEAGYRSFKRVTETPNNIVYEATP